MLLSDRDIRAEIRAGRLGIEPFDEKLVQPSSVDVRLDNFSGLQQHLLRTSIRLDSRTN